MQIMFQILQVKKLNALKIYNQFALVLHRVLPRVNNYADRIVIGKKISRNFCRIKNKLIWFFVAKISWICTINMGKSNPAKLASIDLETCLKNIESVCVKFWQILLCIASTGSSITPVVQFHEIFLIKTNLFGGFFYFFQ